MWADILPQTFPLGTWIVAWGRDSYSEQKSGRTFVSLEGLGRKIDLGMLFKGRGGETDPAGFLQLFPKFWRELQETKKQAEAHTSVKQSGIFSSFLILDTWYIISSECISLQFFWLQHGFLTYRYHTCILYHIIQGFRTV